MRTPRRFVMLNSLLLSSGLADEPCQRAWLERRIDTAGDLRVFLFMHYPPYIYRPDDGETAARAAQAMVLSRCGSDILYRRLDRGRYSALSISV